MVVDPSTFEKSPIDETVGRVSGDVEELEVLLESVQARSRWYYRIQKISLPLGFLLLTIARAWVPTLAIWNTLVRHEPYLPQS